MTGTLTRICRAGLLSSFILISYFAMASSMTLDLTELRNKVSKLKVNPRSNLWATGHFMGKKSVVDGSFMESAFEDVNVPAEVRPVSPLRTVEDLQALLILMLETAQCAHENQALKLLEETLLEEH
ncbi:neuromedin Ba [Hippoglossus stenolepis]|uniref:neuromedin Ba n=1 Tax=Hippoglossus stenolepis TaxID=195615 RepID=UPI00159C146C|nr:neuromedin Ba [Hippoglossus stenolepis]